MRIAVPVILVLTLVMAVAVGRRPLPRADLVYASNGSIHTLDPAGMSYMQDIRAALALWEGLTALHPKTNEPIAGSAHLPPEVSDDGRRYVFTLRADAKWSNGDPLTPADFIRGWRRAIEPGTADAYADLITAHVAGAAEYTAWRNDLVGVLGVIRNLEGGLELKPDDLRQALLSTYASAFQEHVPGFATAITADTPEGWSRAVQAARAAEVDWKLPGDRLLAEHVREMDRRFGEVGVRALDERRLEVRLQRPTAFLLDLAAFSTYLPIHASIELLRERYAGLPLTAQGLVAYDPQWTKPDYHRAGYPGLITNGAYRLVDWVFKQRLWLEANPHYWNASQVRSRTVDMVEVNYESAKFMLYEQGLLDWSGELLVDFAPELAELARSGKRDDIHAIPSFGTYYFVFNCSEQLADGRPNPLRDPRVRRALNGAVDKDAIARHITRLGNPVATTFVPRGTIPGYESPAGLPYDLESARRELAEAGYPGGRGLPVVEILYNTGENHEPRVQALKRMWETALGLKAQLVGKESKTFNDDKTSQRFMVARAGWFGDYGDPTTFLDLFHSQHSNNVARFRDERYDAMLGAAADEADPARRLAILSEAERYLMEEQVPIMPLYVYVSVYAWRPGLTGAYPNPRQHFPLQYIHVGERNSGTPDGP